MTPCVFLAPVLVSLVAWGLSERRRADGRPSSPALFATSVGSFIATIVFAITLLA